MRARSVFVSLLIIIYASIFFNGKNNIVGRVSCEGKGRCFRRHIYSTDRFGNTYTSGITPVLDY